MLDPEVSLHESRNLIYSALQNEILELELNLFIYQLKVVFSTGSILYLRFNEFGEYGYQLLFTKKKGDFVRWDNFDDKWPVSSRPHHYHSRFGGGVEDSSMTGNPSSDIPWLIQFIQVEVF